MYLIQDVVDFLTELKMDMVDIEEIISKGFKEGIKLTDPGLESVKENVDAISRAMIEAEAVMGVVLAKMADTRTSAMMDIDEEIELLKEHSGTLKKTRTPLKNLFGW
ncbi:hypothetical protein [Aeromonas media]|uniref:hypothetical protein n=1 Tax=Aeromonas media TaxID=651 RepID=UPI003D261D0B